MTGKNKRCRFSINSGGGFASGYGGKDNERSALVPIPSHRDTRRTNDGETTKRGKVKYEKKLMTTKSSIAAG